MIKLTINPDSQSETHLFEKEVIVIGNDSENADLPLSEKSAEKIHVKIIKEEGRFLVVNIANDPFTSLNGLPFGKRSLNNGDLIQIGDTFIAVEVMSEPCLSSTPVRELKDTHGGEEREHTVEKLTDAKDIFDKMDAARYYLDEFDDESESWKFDDNAHKKELERSPIPKISVKLLASVVGGCLAFCLFVFSLVYFQASGKNSQEENKIAAGIADIAMAMTYAKLHSILPNKQNWADPDFINSNLSRVLSPNLHSQAQINSQGQFIKYPYILRVYTSSDISKFLIIAQPAPNLLQWLVNKKTIVLDSTAMEIRKIADLKELNKLLATPTPLEGKNGIEISQHVQKGILMALESLSGNKNLWGFTPPRFLDSIRKGAESYIYNGPRYYPFGESLLRKAVELNESPGNSEDVSVFQKEIKKFSQFPDFVLYSSQGLQTALDAQRALSTFSPNSNFLVAYIKFNPKGFVISSHLLMHEDPEEIALLESKDPWKTEELDQPAIQEQVSVEEIDKPSQIDVEKIDSNHPLYLRLQALNAARLRALKPQAEEMIKLLMQHTQNISPEFDVKFGELLATYQKNDNQSQTIMVGEITRLYDEYSDMPLEKFGEYIRAAGLDTFVNDALNARLQNMGDMGGHLVKEEIEARFVHLSDSKTLGELENDVYSLVELLNIDQIPDPDMLISYQSRLTNLTLQKVCFFLLSPQSQFSLSSSSLEEERLKLCGILKGAWITDPDICDYFLSELKEASA